MCHLLKYYVNIFFAFYRFNYEPINYQASFLQDGCRNDLISMESVPFHGGIQATKERYAMEVRLYSKNIAHQMSDIMHLYVFLL